MLLMISPLMNSPLMNSPFQQIRLTKSQWYTYMWREKPVLTVSSLAQAVNADTISHLQLAFSVTLQLCSSCNMSSGAPFGKKMYYSSANLTCFYIYAWCYCIDATVLPTPSLNSTCLCFCIWVLCGVQWQCRELVRSSRKKQTTQHSGTDALVHDLF